MNRGRVQFIVLLTAFLDFFGYALIIPAQPFIAEKLGASPFVFSLLAAVFTLMQVLFAPLWGRLSDSWGRRPVMLLTLVSSVVGYALFGWAPTLVWLFASRVIAGIGGANAATAQAILCDSSTPEDRAKILGKLGATLALGMVAGPALGGVLAQWGLEAPVFAAAGLCAVDLVLAYWFLPETKRAGTEKNTRESFRASIARLWNLADFRRLFFVYIFFATAISMVHTIVGLYIERVWTHFGPGLAGTIDPKRAAAITSGTFIWVAVIIVVIQGGFLGRWVKRFGERRLLSLGLCLLLSGLVLVPVSVEIAVLPVVLLGLSLIATGLGLIGPTLTSLLSKTVG